MTTLVSILKCRLRGFLKYIEKLNLSRKAVSLLKAILSKIYPDVREHYFLIFYKIKGDFRPHTAGITIKCRYYLEARIITSFLRKAQDTSIHDVSICSMKNKETLNLWLKKGGAMKPDNVLPESFCVIGVSAHDPNGEPITMEMLVGIAPNESIASAQRLLVTLLLEDGFTHVSEPYMHSINLDSLNNDGEFVQGMRVTRQH